jgi:hypothetical protein
MGNEEFPAYHRRGLDNDDFIIRLAAGGKVVSKKKACKMLEDGSVRGNPLSNPQRRFFGLICGGGTPSKVADGAVVGEMGASINRALMECLLEDPAFLEGPEFQEAPDASD